MPKTAKTPARNARARLKAKHAKALNDHKKEREKKAQKYCQGKTKLDLKELCEFLEELDLWLAWFVADYEKVRIALCNVERKAFTGVGDGQKRFCKSGPGGDPVPPDKPPTWG